MPGAPVRNKAWAERQVVEQGGRPHRMTVACLIIGREAEAWRGMSHDQQRAALAPYVVEGESIRFSSQTGEAFIVSDAAGGMGQSAASEFTLDELQAAQVARAHWSGVKGKLRREAYQEAYAQATLDFAPKYVELEFKVLEQALKPNATAQERRMAMAGFKDWKDRHLGKPVAPTEDVTPDASAIADWIASEPPSALRLSSHWTVESVGEDQQRALEAGTLALEEE